MEQVKSKRSEQSCAQSTHLGDDNAVVLLSTQIHALAVFFVHGTNSQKLEVAAWEGSNEICQNNGIMID